MPPLQAYVIENDRMQQQEARSCHDTAGCRQMHCKSLETSNGQKYLQLFLPHRNQVEVSQNEDAVVGEVATAADDDDLLVSEWERKIGCGYGTL
jgi:hypothetical protein